MKAYKETSEVKQRLPGWVQVALLGTFSALSEAVIGQKRVGPLS